MNIGSARVVLRHRGMLEVLDLAARFLVEERRAFLRLSALVLLPAYVTCVVLALGFEAWTAAAVLTIACVALLDLPFMLLASRLVFEAEAPLSSVLTDSLKALPRLVVARAIQGAGVGLGFLGCGLPSVWLSALLIFLPEVVAVERTPVFRSFMRCHRLLAGQFGEAVVTTLWLSGLLGGAVLLLDFGGRAILRDVLQIAPPPSVTREPRSLLAMTGLFAVLPYMAVARLFAYLNIRTRNEGWDVQARFVAIAQRMGTAP